MSITATITFPVPNYPEMDYSLETNPESCVVCPAKKARRWRDSASFCIGAAAGVVFVLLSWLGCWLVR